MRYWFVLTFPLACCVFGCKSDSQSERPDHPRLTPLVRIQDVRFQSVALGREMSYRVILPRSIATNIRLPVAYLLHGGGGGFHDWSNYSDVSRFAERGLVLVMPEGESSYYVNSATRSRDRFGDYVDQDLIADVERRFPVETQRSGRAIAGVSMGGYGAVNFALTRPELFAFAGAISAALDVPSRPFSIRRVGQWEHFRSIFGSVGSSTERAGDPFVLVKTAGPDQTPYLYLACGEQEALLSANRRFARDLANRDFSFEFHTAPGGHDWQQWDKQIPGLFESLLHHVR